MSLSHRRSALKQFAATGLGWTLASGRLESAFAQVNSRDDALAILRPYEGATQWTRRAEELEGRVVTGYQGWFNAPTDGAGRGWVHYPRGGKFEPGQCSIDLWPDTSELSDDEKFETPFRRADGSVAHVFSSHHPRTVVRHFSWMREHGIDGAMVQRFAVETRGAKSLAHFNRVLDSCRAGANQHGRTYALMYDLSGLGANQIQVVIDDWKQLVDRMQLGRDDRDLAYLHVRKRPLVAIWGIGFNDQRRYTLEECEQLVRFLRDDPKYGGCTVLAGVPAYWRTLNRDAVTDPKLHDVLKQVDIISPWTVGRFGTPKAAAEHGTKVWLPDREWCDRNQKILLPVAFPGFSWSNLRPGAKFDQIPRGHGEFLWSQYVAARNAGLRTMYQAMFDELDEATAIFKTDRNPPVGESRFVTTPDLPGDHFLWLTGQGARLLRGDLTGEAMPMRRPN
mgnify:CR=1 FL=1